jgi:hypothetical protein
VNVEHNIEKALAGLLEDAAAAGFHYELNVVTSCADTGKSEKDILYPCVVFSCAPFVNDTPGSPLGYCALNVTAMTDQNEDKHGEIVDEAYQMAVALVATKFLGSLVYSPWLLCGINDTGTADVNVDEETNLNIRSRDFQIALADMTSAITTTTTTTGG